MDSVESAVKARKALNNMPLFADGSRINIYFSDREAINFHHSKQLNPGWFPFFFFRLVNSALYMVFTHLNFILSIFGFGHFKFPFFFF